MNYNFFQSNKPFERPGVIVLLACLCFVVLGVFFLQVNSCRVGRYIYSSGRLEGSHASFFCRIF